MSRRVVLFGGSGQLGHALQKLAPADWTLLTPNRDRVDLGAPFPRLADWLDRQQPDVVVNATGYNAVEQAESEPDLARLINATAPAQIARWAISRSTYFVHFSSDYVFSGDQNSPIRPETPTAPLNVYGQSKADGETPFLGGDPPGALVRTSAVFGTRQPKGRTHNFVEKILSRAELGECFLVRNDLTFCPTWADDLARFTVRCVGEQSRGIFHCTSEGATTWFEWAREILLQANYDPTRVVPTRGDPTGLARRPRYTVLACTHGRELVESTPWKTALQRYLVDRHS